MNFLSIPDILDFQKVLDNFEKIKQDYLEFSSIDVINQDSPNICNKVIIFFHF